MANENTQTEKEPLYIDTRASINLYCHHVSSLLYIPFLFLTFFPDYFLLNLYADIQI